MDSISTGKLPLYFGAGRWVIYVGQEYSRDCMLERNRWLVDHSSILLAVYNGTYRSGTGMTVRYAQKLGREVIIIDPVSRWVSGGAAQSL